ncbi:MAG: di-trans,poly-cis-decaprenylcistransferase [Clostridia bacterium]|nr:di-trans,poly-cis-decaprenylcistransferase [Clostridia bacterium]
MPKKDIVPNVDTGVMPRHIGFIMDGNGRWAKRRGMPREYGHRFGADTFRKIMKYCGKLGLEAATFYVFSTENWKRPQKEVDSIMNLLDKYLDECREKMTEYDLRFVFLGDKSVFAPKMRTKMQKIEESSAKNKTIVNLAINYGSRDEIAMAVNKLISEGATKVSEEDISRSLYTKDSPELDLVIRTGGDMRISNFLLWQSAYAELYFTDILWPDFSEADVDAAIENFRNRKRRFGGV